MEREDLPPTEAEQIEYLQGQILALKRIAGLGLGMSLAGIPDQSQRTMLMRRFNAMPENLASSMPAEVPELTRQGMLSTFNYVQEMIDSGLPG